jgi:hypothetical protein
MFNCPINLLSSSFLLKTRSTPEFRNCAINLGSFVSVSTIIFGVFISSLNAVSIFRLLQLGNSMFITMTSGFTSRAIFCTSARSSTNATNETNPRSENNLVIRFLRISDLSAITSLIIDLVSCSSLSVVKLAQYPCTGHSRTAIKFVKLNAKICRWQNDIAEQISHIIHKRTGDENSVRDKK